MEVAKREAATKARHISTLKAQVRALSEALQAERKKSRATVAKLLDDAEGVMAEACGIQSQADHKMSAAEQKLFEEKQKMKAELHNERQFYSREIATCKHLCLCIIMYYRCSHTFVSTFYIIVKDKQEQQLQKQQSEFEADARLTEQQQQKQIDRWKAELRKVKAQLVKVEQQWQSKLSKLDDELSTANDLVVAQKSKYRQLMQRQMDEAKEVAAQVRNYEESFLQENNDLRAQLKKALSDKRAAIRQSRKDKQLAQSRLAKWHEERERRRTAEDYAAQEAKVASALKLTVASYIARVESDQKTKRRMKKEWDDEAAARKRGGGRRWPIWVVQLICELLVCGTSPQAIGPSIKIMYETLYGEKTEEEPPSVNFIRQCRVVVEIMGETVTALKLASADSWKQLWTDATTCRQIPFTALIIGLLGDEEDIDPVIVSSCIFMDDERSETQADGIVNKVHFVFAWFRNSLTHTTLSDKFSSK